MSGKVIFRIIDVKLIDILNKLKEEKSLEKQFLFQPILARGISSFHS